MEVCILLSLSKLEISFVRSSLGSAYAAFKHHHVSSILCTLYSSGVVVVPHHEVLFSAN